VPEPLQEAIAEDTPVDSADAEAGVADEAEQLEVADVVAEAEADAEAPAEEQPLEDLADATFRLPIASRPFNLNRLYVASEVEDERELSEEVEPVAEPQSAPAEEVALEPVAEPEPVAEASPEPVADPAPEISIEPVTKRERRRRQSLADLRPMSLAELIRQSEPRWTRLAEMD
jgi:hypothetical protein